MCRIAGERATSRAGFWQNCCCWMRSSRRLLSSTTPSGAVRSTFLRILRQGNLPTIRFHDLRHTCATLALAARVNPKVVSEMLGHSTIAITLDIYSHVLPDMQQDAAATLEHILFPATGAS